MRSLALRVALTIFLVSALLNSRAACADFGGASGSSGSSWHHELEQAQSSDASTSGFSHDGVLVTAGDELDRDLDLLSRRLELKSLVKQLRTYEKQPVRLIRLAGILGSRRYNVHTVVERLPPEQLKKAMFAHFKSASRVIGLLTDDVAVTTIAAKKPYSDQVALWSLDGESSHALFWRLSPDKRVLRFIGLAKLWPPTVARTLLINMQKLTTTRVNGWSNLDFMFLPPDGVWLPYPLMLKP